MIIVLMGVAGSGKTTIGTLLADELECAYLEGDLLHPGANIDAMSRGIPLTDSDRAPWLAAIRARLMEALDRGDTLVVGCSALKESYRTFLSEGVPITWVYLKGSPELIRSRLLHRPGHFMDASMLDSQIRTLEEPDDAIVVDISPTPRHIVDSILARLGPDVRVLPSLDELGIRAAEEAAAAIRRVVASAGRCSLVLSGGTTPVGLYRMLASRFRDVIPWANVHVFWSDERCVPHDAARSNYRMARDTLLDHVPCPATNIHLMPDCTADPVHAARAYEDTLKQYFAGATPTFDLTLLGLGADGHTASLFPEAPAAREQRRWVLPVTADAEPPSRLTLTLPILTASARTWFVVAGSNKATAVARVLNAAAESHTSPAAAFQHARGRVTWWLDRDAAAHLD